jgi:hypothetical protein
VDHQSVLVEQVQMRKCGRDTRAGEEDDILARLPIKMSDLICAHLPRYCDRTPFGLRERPDQWRQGARSLDVLCCASLRDACSSKMLNCRDARSVYRFGVEMKRSKHCGLRKLKQASVALALLLNMSAIPLIHARDPSQKPTAETGVSVGFGDNFQTSLGGGGNVRNDITFLSLMFSSGRVFKELDGGRSLQLAVEGSVSHAEQDHESRRAAGVSSLLLYNFKTAGRLSPFTEAGLGLMHTNLDPERFGSRLNFTLQAGIGFRYRLSNERSLRICYRLHHISNGGLDDANRSIDSNFLIFGVSFVR